MLEILDTAGQEEYTTLRDQWIRDGEGFVLVYSISSRSSFSGIKRFHHQIQRVKERHTSSLSYLGLPIASVDSQPWVPIMLAGNKSDLATEREVSKEESHALARELGCEFVEASAKNYINVEKAFYRVVRMLRYQRRAAQKPMFQGGSRQRPAGNGDAGLQRDHARYWWRPDGDKCVIL